ncbi:hypothetical protein [Asticcacaulis solisilvae]|uniref:hypothetical protein n=1 Tax=Asticcacaulis solisilvae TaxID=1217274 RepID=UPI003FD84213
MGGKMWEKVWVRLPATAMMLVVFSGFGFVAGGLLANWFAATFIDHVPFPFGLYPNFRWGMLLLVLPGLPQWLLSEPRVWGKRQPLPLGAYLAFIPLFFFVLYCGVFLDIRTFSNNALAGMATLLGCYAAAIVIAGAAGYGYYLFWQKRQDALPPVVPDVF